MDLLDIAEQEPPQIKDGKRFRKVERYPTFACRPQDCKVINACLKAKNWKALNSMGVAWWDQYAQRWFKFTRHFWDHMDYWEIPEEFFEELERNNRAALKKRSG